MPRVREVEVLRRFIPNAVIDVSDGFAADLGHICDASGVGARVDAGRLPLVDAAGLPEDLDALELALGGGEDYELCFTIVPERAEKAAAGSGPGPAPGCTWSGVTGEGGRNGAGRRRHGQPLAAKGWDHLAS